MEINTAIATASLVIVIGLAGVNFTLISINDKLGKIAKALETIAKKGES